MIAECHKSQRLRELTYIVIDDIHDYSMKIIVRMNLFAVFYSEFSK